MCFDLGDSRLRFGARGFGGFDAGNGALVVGFAFVVFGGGNEVVAAHLPGVVEFEFGDFLLLTVGGDFRFGAGDGLFGLFDARLRTLHGVFRAFGRGAGSGELPRTLVAGEFDEYGVFGDFVAFVHVHGLDAARVEGGDVDAIHFQAAIGGGDVVGQGSGFLLAPRPPATSGKGDDEQQIGEFSHGVLLR